MRLILVRHGQSLGNVERRIQGADDPLTDLGRAQANLAGVALASRNDITHLYASNLDRALETASIIGHRLRLDPVPTPGLAEIHAGIAAGLLWAEWSASQSETGIDATARFLHQWEGGESGKQLADRVLAAYDEIVTRHLGSDDVVTIVSHGGPLGWIAARIHGDPSDIWPVDRAGFHNCSISELVYDANGTWSIVAWNTDDHLDSLNR
ncbi:MAG: histidine phosphatase family protein [Thermomicrobiales bacterium]